MLKQSLQQRLLLKLSPQQIQLMKLLQIPTVSLEQRIKEELEVNPALEEGKEEDEQADEFEESFNEEIPEEKVEANTREDFDFAQYFDDDETPGYKLASKNTGPDEERKEIPFSGGTSFQDFLTAQLGLRVLNKHQHDIAENILGNIDDDGYLRREIESLVNDLAFSQNIITTEEEVISLLKIIQEFDPPGIGARNLRESLMLQLQRKDRKNPYIKLALDILTTQFEEFTKKHYEKILRKFNVDDETLKSAVNEILRLNPKPGSSSQSSESSKFTLQIVPDFVINNNEGELELSLNSRNAPELKVSRPYIEMLENYQTNKTREGKDALMFVKQKLDSAKWFIDAIKQRQQTLSLTMQAIMEYQYEFFLTGDETKLRPMILKDIAERVSLDISTISRVANSKYVQTEFGTMALKYFFSESLSTDSGEEVSTREVKKILQDCIEAESKKKPMTDDKLAKILKDKGYNIARRTIAKYREQLNIPVARMRKEL
ncbi:MAG: RNA polymerase factor sigma-54 [Bacteroidetes bacterium]|nr:RNA polymerase factor sigma-54 [Bacteroidota bacterium]